MHNSAVGKSKSATGASRLLLLAAVSAVMLGSSEAGARNHAPGQYLVPPPPPTPVFTVPPPPVMLPYSYALQGPSAQEMTLPQLSIKSNPTPPPKPIARYNPAPVLSVDVARARGFGSPRVASYPSSAGAAQAFPYYEAAASPTWFDQSLRWYMGYQNAKGYYTSLSNGASTSASNPGAPSTIAAATSEPVVYTPPHTVHHRRGLAHHGRHSRRVFASR